jgi:hypothetical protein
VLVALALGQAWRARGSIDAGDWLGYAVVAALVLAVVALSGSAAAPPRSVAAAGLALLALAGWDALSLRWSAAPSLARDEALLTVLYAVALLVPALSIRSVTERTLVAAAVVVALGGMAVATGVELVRTSAVDAVYSGGRLDFPISYQNAAAAFFLVAAWPALSLAARRDLPVAARGVFLGSAVAVAGAWALAQSKGGALGLAVSTLVVFAVSRQRLRLLPPFALTAALVGAAFFSLTEPYRRVGLGPVHHAGRTELVLAASGSAWGRPGSSGAPSSLRWSRRSRPAAPCSTRR